MKKLFIAVIILMATCTVTMAQPRAIGGRLGYGIGASYQHGFGEKNMLQVDLDGMGWYYANSYVSHGWWSIQAVATYNWIFPFKSWNGPGSWNWYTGVGAGIGMNWNHWLSGNAGVAGMIGFEYNFKFPLQLSLDFRPVVGPCFSKHDVYFSWGGLLLNSAAIGVRYKF